MICDDPKWWSLLTYDGFKYHMNVTDALERFAEERIKVGKEDKLQVNQDKAQTRQIMELAWRKVHGRINWWQLIMIISTAIQSIPIKFWTDSFVAVNLHSHHRLYFYGWIKNIEPAVNTVETAYFCNNEGSYYVDRKSVV